LHFMWVWNGRKIKNITLIILASFFAALIAYVQNEEMAVFNTSEGPRALSKVNTNQKQAALTFDLAWGDTRIKQIINILKSEGIKATFFVTGEWANVHPDLINEMKEARFEIESYGMKVRAYTAMEPAEIRKDIGQANLFIKKAGVDHVKFLRPPEGEVNQQIIETASRANMQVVLWSIDPHDDQKPGKKQIVKDVVSHIDKGAIIRLHASDSAGDTVLALPEIIRTIKNKGYSFVTISDLVNNAESKNKIVQ